MKTNIVLVSLYDKMSRSVSKKLATELDLYYADTMDILEYNLQNEDDIAKKCGTTYLNKLKSKILNDIFEYENTLIYLPFTFFLEKDNAENLHKHAVIVFLKLKLETLEKSLSNDKLTNEELKVNLMAYESRSSHCEKFADVVVDIKAQNNSSAFKKTKKLLDKYLL